MNQEEFKLLARKYESGNCSPDERSLYEEICQRLEQQNMDSDASNLQLVKEQQLNRILREDAKPFHNVWKIAAMLVLVSAIGVLLYHVQWQATPNWQVASTDSSHRSKVALPDGSEVILNRNSKIEFPEKFEGKRIVKLTGEAFFEVSRDEQRPFEVHTTQGVTRVLGTSFNVKDYANDHFTVAVKTGKVAVHNQSAKFILHPNELVTNQKGSWKKQADINIAQYVGWSSGIVDLRDLSLSEGVQLIGEFYDVDIEVRGSIGDCLLMGRFENEPFTNVIQGLQYALPGLQLTKKDDGRIILSGSACE